MTATAESAIKLGTDIPLSKIITAIQNVDGVSSVSLTEPISDVVIAPNEYASLTSVAIEILK